MKDIGIERLVSTGEMAEMLGMSATALRKMCRRGELPYYSFGGNWMRFDPDEIMEVLRDAHRTPGRLEPDGFYTRVARLEERVEELERLSEAQRIGVYASDE